MGWTAERSATALDGRGAVDLAGGAESVGDDHRRLRFQWERRVPTPSPMSLCSENERKGEGFGEMGKFGTGWDLYMSGKGG